MKKNYPKHSTANLINSQVPCISDQYDVIGFNLSAIEDYNWKELIMLVMDAYIADLHFRNIRAYPNEVCEYTKDAVTVNFAISNAIWDIENGVILKLG
jgi:hypothetical protein